MVKREGFGNRLEKTRETSEHNRAQRKKKHVSCPSGCLNLGLCFTRKSIQVCEKLIIPHKIKGASLQGYTERTVFVFCDFMLAFIVVM